MVEKKYVRTALTFAALAAHNQAVEAQRFENNAVCGFTVRATALENDNVGYISGNDIAAVGVNRNGLFYISENDGRLYNPDGDRCGFDPYLECSTDTESEVDRSPFEIENDGTITFQGEREFYLCARGAFQRCDALGDPQDCDTNSTVSNNRDDLGDDPRIYPPIGTTGNRQRVFENCTVTELVASQCFGGDGSFVAASSALRSASVPTQTSNADSRKRMVAKRQTMENSAASGNAMRDGMMVGGCFFAAIAFLL